MDLESSRCGRGESRAVRRRTPAGWARTPSVGRCPLGSAQATGPGGGRFADSTW